MKKMMRKAIVTALSALMLAASGSDVAAVALSGEVVRALQERGEYDAYMAKLAGLRAAGMDQPVKDLSADKLALSQTRAVYKVLVLLVDFRDKPYTDGYAVATAPMFDSLLFSDGRNPSGSMREFYLESSYGNYAIEGDVYGWYRVPFDFAEYNNNPYPPSELVREAVLAADSDVDYSQYDNDGNGYVDAVIVVHAGTGYEESGNPDEIHSHMWSIPALPLDGVYVREYTIQPEESAISRTMSAIGVFCHEWGHVVGLPDLYDTDQGATSEGVGQWSVMGSGNYNDLSKHPAHLDAWSKKSLGWLVPTNVFVNSTDVQIPAAEFNPTAFRLRKNGDVAGYEYWLVENRQKVGFDVGLPGAGLLIYHIDESRPDNNDDFHPKVMVEQADGKFDLQYRNNRGDAGDPWPNGTKRDFHDKTVPDSKYYSEVSSQVGVWNISGANSIMTADMEVTFTRPWLEKQVAIFRDDAYGDNDMVLEAGERIQVILSITNDWALADSVTVTMSCDDSTIGMVQATRSFGSIGTGQTISNALTPFEFQVPGLYVSRIDSFFFSVTANGGAYQTAFGAEANVGRPQVLVVDDDHGDPDNLETYYTWPLYQKRTPADSHNKSLSGSPTAALLAKYHVVIWFTGDTLSDHLTAADVTAMKGYLDGGGNMFLSGQGLARELYKQDPSFLSGYLKTTHIDSTYPVLPVFRPVGGPALSGTGKDIVATGTSGANNQKVCDHILPANGSAGELKYLRDSLLPLHYGAISYGGEYKLIFFAFGFEAIKSNQANFATRDEVMHEILDFFGELPTDVEDPSGMAVNLPTQFYLRQNFPNPFNPETRISYLVTGAGGARIDHTRIDVYNVLGQQIVTLVDRNEGPGEYVVTWDGRDQLGNAVASGIYFYRFVRGDRQETRKMLLLK